MNARFWSKVDRSGSCWEWTAYRDRLGYGCFGFHGKVARAHRVSWELANGSIPQGMHVCHHCDNPGCVNPAHLFLGTVADNMRDREARGRRRAPKGERHASAKLADGDVLYIRTLRKEGYLLREIAAICHVGVSQIHRICKGECR